MNAIVKPLMPSNFNTRRPVIVGGRSIEAILYGLPEPIKKHNVDKHQASKEENISFLKDTFMGAVSSGLVIGFAVKMVSRSSVPALTALSGPAGIFASAAVTGTIMMGLEMRKDYVTSIENGASKIEAWKNFISKDSLEKYALNFLTSSAGGALGAICIFWDDLLESTAWGQQIAEKATDVVSNMENIKGILSEKFISLKSEISPWLDQAKSAVSVAWAGLMNSDVSAVDVSQVEQLPSFLVGSGATLVVPDAKPDSAINVVSGVLVGGATPDASVPLESVAEVIEVVKEPPAVVVEVAVDDNIVPITRVEAMERVGALLTGTDVEALNEHLKAGTLGAAQNGQPWAIKDVANAYSSEIGDFAQADAWSQIGADIGHENSITFREQLSMVYDMDGMSETMPIAVAEVVEPSPVIDVATDAEFITSADAIERVDALLAGTDVDALNEHLKAGTLEAAQNGQPWAIKDVADAYSREMGDFSQADAWAQVGADMGHENSIAFREQLSMVYDSEVTPEARSADIVATPITETWYCGVDSQRLNAQGDLTHGVTCGQKFLENVVVVSFPSGGNSDAILEVAVAALLEDQQELQAPGASPRFASLR